MAREWLERVQDYPRLRSGWVYPLYVATVEKVGKSAAIRVRFEHLDPEQAGRVAECTLPLPILPGGLTKRFFRASGMNVEVGMDLAPSDVVGQEIWAEFAPSEDGLSHEVIGFEDIAEEDIDEHAAERKSGNAAAEHTSSPGADEGGGGCGDLC